MTLTSDVPDLTKVSDAVNNNNNSIGESKRGCKDLLTLYVRAGADNKQYGACPFSQRIFMVLMLKASKGALRFQVATVPRTGLPDEFKEHGLRNLPAMIHRGEAIDTVEEILDYIESVWPQPELAKDSILADQVTRNFFSRFCYFIKAVSKDSSALDQELAKLDGHLKTMQDQQLGPFLGGELLSHLDCEILPKLHHLRVAASCLRSYQISAHLHGLWRYLHAAYACETFVKTCPPDQEIVLRWADRPDTPRSLLSGEERAALSRKQEPRFSFDVPAFATPVKLVS